MTYALICILSLVVLGIVAAIANRYNKASETQAQPTTADCGSCDGTNTKCEQECMMEASLRDIEYFDDEELDQYAGRPSDSYSDEEAEQFREVLYTMRPDEAAPWSRSLTLRGIAPPDQIKDELLLLIGDTRL